MDDQRNGKMHEMPGQYEYEPGLVVNRTFPRHVIDKIKDLDFQEKDVLVATYGKAGTTWTQEIVYLVHTNADLEAAKERLASRVPHLELANPNLPPEEAGLYMLENMNSPRLLKTHLTRNIYDKALEAGKAKFVVTMRNVKDNLVSFYHFYKAMRGLGNFTGTWEDFFEMFKAKKILWGDWLDFNLGWWQARDHPNVLILKYEDMKRDPHSAVRKIAEFCEQDLSKETIDKIVEHTAFDKMKDNPACNYSEWNEKKVCDFKISPFMRKGTVGDWQSLFTEEQIAYVDEHYVEKGKQYGLEFDYEL